ncbi:MAG: DinB family protein [Candidatus Kariarchaeaceae archaeon]|jgi:uncharacterized damage-inducible protein DinB
MKALREYWQTRYEEILKKRENLWNELEKQETEESWLHSRLTEHQWSIDEVLRHLLGSEVVYIQQPIDGSIVQYPKVVPAQWVGNVFFRYQEDDHVPLKELRDSFDQVQQKSRSILSSLTDEKLNQSVIAPWRQEVSYEHLIEHCFDHELSHLGQVYFMLTYFRGPPKFESNWFEDK